MSKRADRRNRETFASALMDVIRTDGVSQPMGYHAGRFEIFLQAEPDTKFCLGNVYGEFQSASREHRPMLLQRWSGLFRELLNSESVDKAVARTTLLPVVRERCYYEFNRLHAELSKKPTSANPFRAIAGDLALGLAVDQPNTIRCVTEADLSSWGFSFEDALFIATENLRKRSAEDFVRLAPGTYSAPWRDNYASSRLILADRIRNLDVRGTPVAVIPNRDTLLITGSDDLDGVAMLAKEVRKAVGAPWFRTGVAVCLSGDEWTPYIPTGNTPAHRELKALRLETTAGEYAGQTNLLQSKYSDCFVASFMAGPDQQTGELFSTCAWTKQTVPALLPKTDRIAFIDADILMGGGGPVAFGDWDDFRAVVGDLMQPQGIYPERYLITRNPSPEQLRALPRNEKLCRSQK